jgi:membrane protein YdbS with pleckstrin-like domain
MGEEILLKFRKTRKAFWIEYLCGLFLISLLIIMVIKGITIPIKGYFFVGGLAALSIGSAEFTRLLYHYTITPSKILIKHGLIKQTKRYIFIPSIADLDVKQTRIERLLRYGTIHFRSMSGEGTLKVTNINRPYDVMELVERLMEKYKKDTEIP